MIKNALPQYTILKLYRNSVFTECHFAQCTGQRSKFKINYSFSQSHRSL